jgi:hypothetical protein
MMKSPVTEGEIGAGIWKCPKTDHRVSVEKRSMLDIV